LPDWLAPFGHFRLHYRQQACDRTGAGNSAEQAVPHCNDPTRLTDPSTLRRWARRRLTQLNTHQFRQLPFSRIAESDTDVIGPRRRKALLGTYPQAKAHTFHNAGHAPLFTRDAEYLRMVQDFLKEYES
jgi:hypothetical protein